MNKLEFTKLAHESLKEKKLITNIHQTTKVVNLIFDLFSSQLSQGKKIQIDNLGTFNSKIENRTNTFASEEGVSVSRFIIRFKASPNLKKRINADFKKPKKTS